MNRRTFMKRGAQSAAALAVGKTVAGCQTTKSERIGKAGMPMRRYRDTGDMLSVIGFGAIVVMNAEQDHANRVVAESFERGVNYYDVAPSYGNAQEKLGPALAPYRKDSFLACKTAQRGREEAEREFAESLELLQTDYFDLYQLHAITQVDKDVDAVFQKGGVMDMIDEKKRSGQIRYVGFSAHSQAAALTAMQRYDFDSALFPVNFACWHKGGFGPEVVRQASERNMAVLALKATAKQKWQQDDPRRPEYPKSWYEPITDPHLVELSLRWTLSQPVTAAVPPGTEELYRLALDCAPRLRAVTRSEEQQLAGLAKDMDPLFWA